MDGRATRKRGVGAPRNGYGALNSEGGRLIGVMGDGGSCVCMCVSIMDVCMELGVELGVWMGGGREERIWLYEERFGATIVGGVSMCTPCM